MTSVRAAKAKGSSFEYDCQHNLKKLFPEIYRTSERGFQLQYDLECDKAVFECKRLKGISWNQAKKFFFKLKDKSPEGKDCYLMFQSNRQPALVMHQFNGELLVREAEDLFAIRWEKHPSTRIR